ncbi:MAG TPA: hypothetical protein VM695_06675 [Phycisphaerae bacterium]|nr:hypothetical protein [Phycisphaerae bacterium]
MEREGHEAICECAFTARCTTFDDPLIDEARKGPTGLGCHQQSDVYRAQHCKPFACKYLTVVFHDALKQPTPHGR